MADNMTVYVGEDESCWCQWCAHATATGHYIEIDDVVDNRQKLSDWHDHAHGLTLWAACPHEPCKLLTDEFRRTP